MAIKTCNRCGCDYLPPGPCRCDLADDWEIAADGNIITVTPSLDGDPDQVYQWDDDAKDWRITGG